jgi:hypothetical protein
VAIRRSDSGSDTPTLCSKSLDTEVISSMNEDGSSDSNTDFGLDDPCSSEENESLSKQGRIRWSKSEDEQLREKWPPSVNFLHRTAGAVRTRWHMLQARVYKAFMPLNFVSL